jgi:O-antigen ligase
LVLERASAFIPNSPLAWLASVYLLLLLLLGGGGSPAAVSELLCEIVAALALTAWVALGGPHAMRGQIAVVLVAGLVVALPLVQLIPLPAGLWQLLPGREMLRDSLTLVNSADTWRPISVAPQRTLEALLSLLPPLLAMLLVASLTLAERQNLLKLIALFALLSIAIGAAQIASNGSGPFHFYAGAEPGVLFGFQANRNAQVDVLLIGLLAAVAAWAAGPQSSRGAAVMLGAMVLLILLGVVLTRSRAGIALVPVVIGWCLLLRPWQPKLWTLWLSGLVIGGLVVAVLRSRGFESVLARFEFADEYRPDIWRDTLFAIDQYWPLGSGLGTFTRVIGAAERLETIGPALPNRAHNEYLELLLEAGIGGALVWGTVAVLAIGAVWRGLKRDAPVPLPQAVFAGGTLMVVILHALVDYPLRSMGLAGLVGVAAALVLTPPKVRNPN